MGESGGGHLARELAAGNQKRSELEKVPAKKLWKKKQSPKKRGKAATVELMTEKRNEKKKVPRGAEKENHLLHLGNDVCLLWGKARGWKSTRGGGKPTRVKKRKYEETVWKNEPSYGTYRG